MLTVQVEIDISPEARKGVSVDGKKETTVTMPISVFIEDAAYSLGHRCRDLFLCLTIARPGIVRLQDGALYINGRFSCKADGVYGGLEEAAQYVKEKLKWPEIKTLPIMKVWEWIGRLNGFNHGIGEGPVGRAVAALSYLAIDNTLARNDLDIVWALMGLEAVYCDGNSGVMNQLFEKCQVLLGPVEKDKKLVRDMYNLRSRVVHGDLDFPVCYSYYDSHPQYDKFHQGTYLAALLAQAMLVATIQQLVERNLLEVRFKFALDA